MDALGVLTIMFMGLVLFLPAMIPNSAAAFFGGGTPIDFNKTWRGKRILGDGKTWRGFLGGILTGILLGILILQIAYMCGRTDDYFGYGQPYACLGVVCCLACGSILGDMCGAFIKRRMGLERGHNVPILDQYDFVIGAFVLTAIFFPDFVYNNYIEGWHIAALIFLLAIMFAIHRGMNIIGYKMGVKKEPW